MSSVLIALACVIGWALWFDLAVWLPLETSGLGPFMLELAVVLLGLVWGVTHDPATLSVRTAEALTWSWSSARAGFKRWARVGGVAGFAFSLAFIDGRDEFLGLINPLPEFWGATCLVEIILWSVQFGTVAFVICGLDSQVVPVKSRPNQGIRLSATNAAKSGLVTGGLSAIFMAIALLFYLNLDPPDGAPETVAASLVLATVYFFLAFGCLSAVWSGGAACIRHFTLRALITASGQAPWNYARFLDYAAERVLLQKVGGGYIFVHRLVLEHFAAPQGGVAPASPA